MSSELGLSGIDERLEARLRAGLDEVDRQLASTVSSDTGFVTEAARHLLQAGGKRFRPLLALLGAEFGAARAGGAADGVADGAADRVADGVVAAALVVELTHVATLYHDDVMDEATLRRGGPSANARWSNTIAILTGDYLFARASTLVAGLGPECVDLQAATFARLVEGQLRETLGPPEGADPVEHYLGVVRDKTASLISTSVRLGAMVAGATPADQERLAAFGDRIGVAFQLSDDVLDLASESAESGKTPGTDLREGVPTLPVLLALGSAGAADAEPGSGPGSGTAARLRELLAGDLREESRVQEALRLLRAHPALDAARVEARRWSEEARSLLGGLAPGPARDALEALCDSVVLRTS